LPSKSYISFKGQIKRADNNNTYVAANEITLVNNAMINLFTGIKYKLGNTTIEFINHPGQTTSMLGYLSYPDDFSTSTELTCCWSKDTCDIANSSKYSRSVEAPSAGFTPSENPNYNQGFAIRKGYLFSSDPLGWFKFNFF